MTPLPKTFLSYARADAEFVLKLASDLRQAGANIWLDRLDIPPGARWDRAVERALEECPRLLVILSPDSVSSDNVLDEVHYALDEVDKEVIPALYRECKIPLRLRRLQRVDLTTGIDGLLAALGVRPEAAVTSDEPAKRKPEGKPASPVAAVERETPVLPDGPAKERTLTPEGNQLFAELKLETTSHLRRRDIGQRLAEIGDPRRGVGVVDGVPDMLWRPIPGGKVEIYGHGRFPVQPFHMAAFAVTFGQFRAFLEAKDGFGDKRWWQDLEQRNLDSAWKSSLLNHPVTDVSWPDATAYCRWLSATLGFEVRLPDEQEWQWAAQSALGDFEYPWGPDWREGLANTKESGIAHTTAVGMYPQGASLQEVSDLAGNVWEWCRGQYEDPKKTGAGGYESRVLRGGSWFYGLDLASLASRFHFLPDSRDSDVGFRVVCSSPIR